MRVVYAATGCLAYCKPSHCILLHYMDFKLKNIKNKNKNQVKKYCIKKEECLIN